MNTFRGLAWLSKAYLRQSLRSRTAILWNLAFPLLWLFVFGFIFGRGNPDTVTVLMPGLFTITTISGSFFGVSYLMVNERETGILRRYRVTPVTAATLTIANAVRALATLSVSLLVQGLVAWLVFHVRVTGSLMSLAAMLLLGATAFVPLGLFVGSVAQDMKSAPAISNLIFFPMMFVSGAAVPFFMLPEWLQVTGRLLPATYLVEGLQGVIVRGEGLVELQGVVAVLLLTTAIGAALNGMLFRWESDEPINRRKLALAIGGLATFFTVAALLAPTLRMTNAPTSFGDATPGERLDGESQAGEPPGTAERSGPVL